MGAAGPEKAASGLGAVHLLGEAPRRMLASAKRSVTSGRDVKTRCCHIGSSLKEEQEAPRLLNMARLPPACEQVLTPL